jgi:hypothetical protein
MLIESNMLVILYTIVSIMHSLLGRHNIISSFFIISSHTTCTVRNNYDDFVITIVLIFESEVRFSKTKIRPRIVR